MQQRHQQHDKEKLPLLLPDNISHAQPRHRERQHLPQISERKKEHHAEKQDHGQRIIRHILFKRLIDTEVDNQGYGEDIDIAVFGNQRNQEAQRRIDRLVICNCLDRAIRHTVSNPVGDSIEDSPVDIPVVTAEHIGQPHEQRQRPHIPPEEPPPAVYGVAAIIKTDRC